MTRPADLRGAGRASAGFSAAMREEERSLKRFMYDKLYYHPEQLANAARARTVIAELYAAYAQAPGQMEQDWHARLPAAEPQRSRHIADYIAGMTDRYAIRCHAQIYGHTPDGLRNV
jgi:dGTPase